LKGEIKKFEERKKIEFGDLTYSIYFDTGLLTSGIATVAPNGKGDLDEGHKDAEEVFTVAKGTLTIIFPDSDLKYELNEGDSLLIPPEESHIVENPTNEEAILIFTGAPGL